MANPAVSFKLKGDREMIKAIIEHADKFPQKIEKALNRRAEKIMTRSKKEFVPKDNGILANSGHVLPVKRNGRLFSIDLVYDAPHALAVHEHPSDHSPRSWVTAESQGHPVTFHPAGHGPKYLEIPLMEAVETLPSDLAEDLKL